VYGGPAQGHVSKDELDDLLILDAWLRRHAEEVVEVPVQIDAPETAAPALREAMTASALEAISPV
jgi:hypothetical protein